MSWAGMPSVMATQSLMPASAASMIESAAKGGGTKTMLAVAPVFSTASLTVLKTGTLLVLPPLPGRYAADDVGAVGDHLLGVEAADLAGNAQDDDRRGAIEKDGHDATAFGVELEVVAPGGTARLAASARVLARMIGRPQRARILRPSSTCVPARRTTTGTLQRILLQRLDDAFGDPVAAVDAGEDVDQDRLHIVVRHDQAERLGDALRRRAAADIEEVRRLAARQLDHVHGRHGEAGAIDDAADIAVEADIGETAISARVSRASSCDLSRSSAMCGWRNRALSSKVILASSAMSAVLGDDQRIDLHHGGIEVFERLVAAQDDRDRLLRQRRPMPRPKAISRAWKACMPTAGSTLTRRMCLAFRGDVLDFHVFVLDRKSERVMVVASAAGST